MTRNSKKGHNNIEESFPVELIPTYEACSEATTRKLRVRKILTLMYLNLDKKGRPAKRLVEADNDIIE